MLTAAASTPLLNMAMSRADEADEREARLNTLRRNDPLVGVAPEP